MKKMMISTHPVVPHALYLVVFLPPGGQKHSVDGMNDPVAGKNVFPQYYWTVLQHYHRFFKPIPTTDLVFVKPTAMRIRETTVGHLDPFFADQFVEFKDGVFHKMKEQQIRHIVSVECPGGNTGDQCFNGFVGRCE